MDFRFAKAAPQPGRSVFDRLFELFQELLLHTAGDVEEALSWMTQLDEQYQLTTDTYGIADFIDELKRRGYLRDGNVGGGPLLSAKMEQSLRQGALEEIFGKVRKGQRGQHRTGTPGAGTDPGSSTRPFAFGDRPEHIAMTESLRNAQVNHGIDDFVLREDDLEVYDAEATANTSTVLMIDISHSMILYGEDRITPARKVALALAQMIQQQYPRDTIDILAFGDTAWPIELKDLPYLQVGPYHTNTVAGLELALEMLRKRRNPNRQIFMITDGKPSCMFKGKQLYKNSFGLDRKIVGRCLTLARHCRKSQIPITTFMVATDPYLQEFVASFSAANGGQAFYTGLDGLGSIVLDNYGRRRNAG